MDALGWTVMRPMVVVRRPAPPQLAAGATGGQVRERGTPLPLAGDTPHQSAATAGLPVSGLALGIGIAISLGLGLLVVGVILGVWMFSPQPPVVATSDLGVESKDQPPANSGSDSDSRDDPTDDIEQPPWMNPPIILPPLDSLGDPEPREDNHGNLDPSVNDSEDGGASDLDPSDPLSPEPPLDPPPVDEGPETIPPSSVDPAVARDRRLKTPSREQQQQVLSQLQRLYPPEKMRTVQQQRQVASQLLQLGDDPRTDPLERFVLLRRAAELGSQAGDVELLSDAVSMLGDEFQLDSGEVESALLVRMAQQKYYRHNPGDYISHVASFAKAEIDAERFDVAGRALEGVLTLPSPDLPPAERVRLQAVLDKAKSNYELMLSVRDAQRAIAVGRADAEAHFLLARWHCFHQGNWTQGLPHLAKSSHVQLSTAAKAEMNADIATDIGRIAAGHAWWDIADQVEAPYRAAVIDRAGHWYQQVRLDSLSGLDKIKFEHRLAAWNDLQSQPAAADTSTEEPVDDKFVELLHKGNSAVRDKDYSDADRYFSHCLRMAPNSSLAINNSALTALRLGQTQKAIRLWQRLIDDSIPCPGLAQNLGRVRMLISDDRLVLNRSATADLDKMIAQAEAAGSYGSYDSQIGFLFSNVARGDEQSWLEGVACLACRGTAMVECPAKGCSRGSVRVTDQQVIARNPITGAPIIRSTPVPVPCDYCSGAGRVECPHCSSGVAADLDGSVGSYLEIVP